MQEVLFYKDEYETAATKCVDTLQKLELQHGHVDAVDREEYQRALTLLSIMNTIRDVDMQPFVGYAEANGILYKLDPADSETFNNVPLKEITAAVYYAEPGLFWDITLYYKTMSYLQNDPTEV